MRDFLPQDVRRREYVIGVVEDVYRGYGFQPLETPALENIETLTGKYGEEGNKLIFKVLRRGEHESSGETDLALRYDLTVPLARVVAEHRGKLPRFFKRYQIQPVWRADRPARGRFREFYQCDVDAIGSRSMVVETELCAAVADVLQRLGFQDFVIRLNDRRILSGLLDAAGVPADLHGQALVALDKMDKIGPDGVRRELQERGIAADGERVLAAFSPQATTGDVRRFLEGRAEALAAVDALDEVFALSSATSAGCAPALRRQPGARAVVLHRRHHGDYGAGSRRQPRRRRPLRRADRDVPRREHPRVRVLARPRAHPRGDGRARRCFRPASRAAAADVLVTLFEGEDPGEALRLARELRAAGLRVEVYPEPDKLGKQFKYAARSGDPASGGPRRRRARQRRGDDQGHDQREAEVLPARRVAGTAGCRRRRGPGRRHRPSEQAQ